jgi:spore coat protein U-like protein
MKSKQFTTLNGRVIRMVVASALALGTGFSGVNSYAGSANSSMTVSATVAANCVIFAGALAFGSYDPVVSHSLNPLDGQATLTVTCTSGSAAKIMLGQGANANIAGGSTDAAPLRRMLSGGNYLSYQLYQEAGRSTVWGNTNGPTSTGVSYLGTGSSALVTVYGRVTGGQNVPAGSYSDSVIASIDF